MFEVDELRFERGGCSVGDRVGHGPVRGPGWVLLVSAVADGDDEVVIADRVIDEPWHCPGEIKSMPGGDGDRAGRDMVGGVSAGTVCRDLAH